MQRGIREYAWVAAAGNISENVKGFRRRYSAVEGIKVSLSLMSTTPHV
jgi:hypothetical protein